MHFQPNALSPRLVSTLRLAALAWTLFCSGCGLPHDPRGTLDEVRGGVMQVGLTEAAPWVTRGPGGEPGGIEVELAKSFAEGLGVRIQWLWGGADEHLAALERYQLHLVLAGLTDASPWKKNVAFTRPYCTSVLRVGFPPGSQLRENLDGLRVAVREGSAAAALVRAAGAEPEETTELSASAGMPVAAPEWQLRQWEFTVSNQALHRERHVMAVPPGENGWLVALERFLGNQRHEVRAALERASAP